MKQQIESQVSARVKPRDDRVNGRSIAALVLGFICLCLGPMGVLPIIVGTLALMRPQARSESQGKGLAITGIVLGVIGVLGTFVWWLVINQFLIDVKFGASKGYVASHAVALKIYAQNNNSAFPSAEQWPWVLIENGLIEDILLHAPNADGDDVSYIYVPDQILDDNSLITVYEDPKHWPLRGVVVGFADGHVEAIDHDTFERMLAEQLAAQSSP
jgi:prepilin-type processing-associated H-X9-DG protein